MTRAQRIEEAARLVRSKVGCIEAYLIAGDTVAARAMVAKAYAALDALDAALAAPEDEGDVVGRATEVLRFHGCEPADGVARALVSAGLLARPVDEAGAAAIREVAELRARMEDARKLAEWASVQGRYIAGEPWCAAQRILAHPAPVTRTDAPCSERGGVEMTAQEIVEAWKAVDELLSHMVQTANCDVDPPEVNGVMVDGHWVGSLRFHAAYMKALDAMDAIRQALAALDGGK